MAQTVKNLPQCRRIGLQPRVRKIPWRRDGTHSSIPAWRTPWTEEPGGLATVCGFTKSRTRLSNSHLTLAFYCLRHFLEIAVYQVLCLLRIYAFVCLGVGTEREPLPTFKIPLGTCSVGHTLCLLGIQPSWVSRAVRNEPGACSLFPKEHWTSVEHL